MVRLFFFFLYNIKVERDDTFMERKDGRVYTDFSNVRSMRNELVPEEYPEGSFGSPINEDEPVEGKSTPWEKGQRRQSAYVYSYKALHDDLPRQTPGAHPLHDEEGEVKPEDEEQ